MQNTDYRPLVFFDLETTGPDITNDRIVEIALLKEDVTGFSAISRVIRLNPGIPIPASATVIHGISDSDVQNEPTFAAVAPEILEFILGCDLAGYNCNRFDYPLLVEEFMRVGITLNDPHRLIIDAYQIFIKNEERTLSAALKFYCDRNHDGAHGAMADVVATRDVLKAQLKRYGLNGDRKELHDYTSIPGRLDFAGKIVEKDLVACFAFGKYKDQQVLWIAKSDPGYIKWMLAGDFPLYTKHILKQIIKNES